MRLFTALLLIAVATPAVAQEREIRNANLPRELEWRLLRMYEGDATRYEGDATIPYGQIVQGDVAALGGPLRIAGRVTGDVAMVGGDVVMEPGGEVLGSVTVVGGHVALADDARIAGTITAYGASDRVRRAERDRGRDRDDDWDDWDDDRDRDRWYDRGRSRLTLRTGTSYNRVEGLPVMFGPVIRTGGENPLELEALVIWRTEAADEPFDTDRMGYRAEIEQFLGGRRRFSIGGSAFSLVDPLDPWQITDLEASLATVVFHEDYRDHFDRTGWSAFAAARPLRPLEARVEYRQEEHNAVPSGDPWSLFDGSDPWRFQPLIAQGDVQLLAGSLELDFRDERDEPRTGWLARLRVERPVGGDLARPEMTGVFPPPDGGSVPGALAPRPYELDFTTALVDIRRHLPVGYDAQLDLRVVGAGSLAEQELPPQFQHALGGLGTLPGFETFHADCGARSAVGLYQDEQFFPSYGCDRILLAQAEYRGSLSLDFGFGAPDYYDDEEEDDDWWDEVGVEVDLSPTWAVFFDAAHGWAYPDGADAIETGTLYDVGVGLMLGDIGIYGALPLNGDVEQEPRFFVRLGRRF